MNPEISVVMGVHNGAADIEGALRSILDQDVDLEVVVVDDGSTDDTSDQLALWASSDARVRVLSQAQAGLTAALIRGCDAARGRFVARQDADDRSLPGRLQRQRDALSADSELTFLSCWSRAIGPAGELLWEATPPHEPAPATRSLVEGRMGPPGHGTVMFRADAYRSAGGYRREFYFAQDADLWLRLAERGSYALVPAVLYEVKVDEHGISSRHAALQARLGRLARECYVARRGGESEAAPLAQAASLRPTAGPPPPGSERGAYFIGRCLTRQRDPRAVDYLRRAVRQRPCDPRSWLGLAQALWVSRGARSTP